MILDKLKFLWNLYICEGGWIILPHKREGKGYVVRFHNAIVKLEGKLKGNGIIQVNKNLLGLKKSPHRGYFVTQEGSEVQINGKFNFYNGASIFVSKGAKLVLNNGYINTSTEINCFNYIEIGDETIISDNVKIHDSDNHEIIMSEGVKKDIFAPVIIGNHVWIGKNVLILKGVHIGDNAIVGAGSVVTKNVPAGTLVVGNPARVIKENVKWVI